MSRTSNHGFTLIELLATIAVVTILFFSSAPLVRALNQSDAVDCAELLNLLHQARKTAVFSESRVIVCPMDDSQQCANDWSLSLTAFQDNNSNNTFDEGDTLLQSLENEGFGLSWDSANEAQFISFNTNGGAGENIGKLTLTNLAFETETKILMPITGQAKIL